MDWSNYLLEEKSPSPFWTHLGVFEGETRGIYDLSLLPNDTKILSLKTPVKKSKVGYTNYGSLAGNKNIEAIVVNDIDEKRLNIFSTLSNLKYFEIKNNRQDKILDLSCLKSLEVLVLADITRIDNIDFLNKMEHIKTLYIYCIKNLYDLEPLSNLRSLEELFLHHGLMSSGTGKAIKSMEPLKNLTELKYLVFNLTVEGKNRDIIPITYLKKLVYLNLLPKYLKNGQDKILFNELPLLKSIQ